MSTESLRRLGVRAYRDTRSHGRSRRGGGKLAGYRTFAVVGTVSSKQQPYRPASRRDIEPLPVEPLPSHPLQEDRVQGNT